MYSPFLNLKFHGISSVRVFFTMKEIPVELWAPLRLLLFYICFRSLLINTRLILISYFVQDRLRKGHKDLEYQRSFVRLYLFLFAFLIICIETFGFRRLLCIETFGFRRLFCIETFGFRRLFCIETVGFRRLLCNTTLDPQILQRIFN